MPSNETLLQAVRPSTIKEVHDLLNRARNEGIEYFPSPQDWRDEVLYFLLPDRFSDGKENTRSLLTREEIKQLRENDDRTDINWRNWAESGNRWQGGTIKGIEGKLDYLAKLKISCIWIAPVFKQRTRVDSYHGYGIQDFLEVDPRFGTRRDLIDLTKKAHEKGIKIILDVIINHSGDNWGYVPPGNLLTNERGAPYRHFPDYYGNPNNEETRNWKTGWRNEEQSLFTEDGSRVTQKHDGVWPKEFQDFQKYTRVGSGSLNDNDLGNAHAEHKRTDFYSLKDFALDAPGTLNYLSDCFKYWIALTDCDGFRIDTVKHISLEEARNFCGSIIEFAESIGKRNFFIVGEVAGGDNNQDFVIDHTSIYQRNLKAALDIGSGRINLHNVGKGLTEGSVYLESFKEDTKNFDSHRSFGNRHVSVLDDHDHVSGEKVRFSAEIPDGANVKDYHVVVPIAIQLFTLGIPCIYYGDEQAFAGPAQSQLKYLTDFSWKQGDYAERYLREAMFGPAHPRGNHNQQLHDQLGSIDASLPGFGAFGTTGKHCFDTNSPSYLRIAALCRVRSQNLVLRVGRQYQRQTRVMGSEFSLPKAGELVAWSRILDTQEVLCVVNPNGSENAFRGGDILVSSELWQARTEFTVLVNTAEVAAAAARQPYHGSHASGSKVQVKGQASSSEPAYVEIRDIGPAEVLVLAKL